MDGHADCARRNRYSTAHSPLPSGSGHCLAVSLSAWKVSHSAGDESIIESAWLGDTEESPGISATSRGLDVLDPEI